MKTVTTKKLNKNKDRTFRKQLERINKELRQGGIDAKQFIELFNGEKNVFPFYQEYCNDKGKPKSNDLTVEEDKQFEEKLRESNADEHQYGERKDEIDEKDKGSNNAIPEESSDLPEPEESLETEIKKSIKSLRKLIAESAKKNPISLDFITEDEKRVLRKLPELLRTPAAKKAEVAAARAAAEKERRKQEELFK